MNKDIASLSDLPDEHHERHISPRLDAVIEKLPKYQQVRIAFVLDAIGVRTTTDLCATRRSDLRRLKNLGKRSITSLENTLTMCGLALTTDRSNRSKKAVKTQTPNQRITNAVWLRQQIAQIVRSCDESIAEDQARADHALDDTWRARHLASVDCHRHWKRQLERVLAGKTAIDALADALIQQEARP